MMHITHMWLIILLHRPFYRKVSPIPGSGSEEISESVKVSRPIWLWIFELAGLTVSVYSNAIEQRSVS